MRIIVFFRRFYRVLFGLIVAAGIGCGGDNGGVTGPKRPPAANSVHLQSDAGDYIGSGQTYDYSQANAVITVTATGGHLSVAIDGDEWWYGEFQTPSGNTQLVAGNYAAGVDWSGEGRGCGSGTGSFRIDSVTYVAGILTAIDLRFDQRCTGATGALHGTIHWRSDDATRPPGPVRPIPTVLWQPPAGSTPSAGNYVYLQSDAGDFIGGGQTYTYVPGNSTITITANGGRLSVTVDGWSGDFLAMNTLSQMQSGYYADLQRYPFHNPAKGGLSWSGNGRGCNTLLGWFAVDAITYVGSTVTALDLRFEQHCEGGTPALRGAIHWSQ